jgi:hypothetical protein
MKKGKIVMRWDKRENDFIIRGPARHPVLNMIKHFAWWPIKKTGPGYYAPLVDWIEKHGYNAKTLKIEVSPK